MVNHFSNKKIAFFLPDPPFWSSFWLVNMGMAKKEIFNTQSKFFCQLDEINKIFVFRAFRDKVCLFLVGESVFNVLSSHSFFSLLSSFFTARFVAHFIVFPLCGVLAGYLFRKRAKSSR